MCRFLCSRVRKGHPIKSDSHQPLISQELSCQPFATVKFLLCRCHCAQIRTEPFDGIQTLQFAGFLGTRTGHGYNKQKICEHCCGLALFSPAAYPQCVCANARRREKGLGIVPAASRHMLPAKMPHGLRTKRSCILFYLCWHPN